MTRRRIHLVFAAFVLANLLILGVLVENLLALDWRGKGDDGDTGSGGGGTGTGSDGDGTGGTSETGDTGTEDDECDTCIAEECGDEFVECYADALCQCWMECFDGGNYEECAGECGEVNEVWDSAYSCYVDAATGPCAEVCQGECLGCAEGECGDEFSDCYADEDCACWLDCYEVLNRAACEADCGPANAAWDTTFACYEGAVGGVCADSCEEHACLLCIYGACPGELDACAVDDLCTCWLDCYDTTNEAECEAECGAANQAWDDTWACAEPQMTPPDGACAALCS